jgi:MarR family transcriptional regulator for hemolysin
LVNKKYISRSFHSEYRRRFFLVVTEEGKKLLAGLQPVINDNRIIALKGISKLKIVELREKLNQIISNCTM